MKQFNVLMGILLLFSCSENQAEISSVTENQADTPANTSLESTSSTALKKGFGEKKMGNIHYSASVMTAIEFIERKGEQIAELDRKQLEKEQVLMFEISLADLNKDILQSPQLQLSEDDAMNYLAGQIAEDLTVEQAGKNWKPNGVNFESRTGAVNKLRVQFFMGALDPQKAMKIVYYDRLMGQGLIKFGINEQ